jgi:hypothetical protein
MVLGGMVMMAVNVRKTLAGAPEKEVNAIPEPA